MKKKNQQPTKNSEPAPSIDARAIRYREAAFEVRGEGEEQSVRMSVSSGRPSCPTSISTESFSEHTRFSTTRPAAWT